MMSRSPRPDDQGREGQLGQWLAIRVLGYLGGIQLYDPKGNIRAREPYYPTIQGQRKETLDRSLWLLS
jgi:hypothetical protein